jgi:hypothetical protein
MRRISGALIITMLVQLITPAPADAWWEFIEPWSGPGWWKGPDIDARLVCFVDSVSRPEANAANKRTEEARQFANARRNNFPAWDPQVTDFLSRVKTASTEWTGALNNWETVLNEWQLLAARSADKAAPVRRLVQDVRRSAESSGRSVFSTAEALVALAPSPAIATAEAKSAYEIAQANYKNAVTETLALADAYDRSAEAIASIALMGHALAFAGPGFIFSACRLREYDRRRAAIDVGMRFAWTNDDRYAGGERMMFTTIEPAFSWSIFDDPKYDFVDYGIGAGFFWISSRAFPSVKGGFLEPARFDFHLPTSALNHTTRSKILRALVFRVGWLNFPGGFEASAFLPDPDNPDVNRRIGRDLVRYYGIYIDTEIFHKRKPALPKP